MKTFKDSSPISVSMEELSPAKAFKIVNGYLGWGDPGKNGPGIWFIGIEEASEWGKPKPGNQHEAEMKPIDLGRMQVKKKDEELRRNAGWYEYDSWKPTKSRVLDVMDKIAHELSVSGLSLEGYRKDKLWRAGCKVFQTNLYPLGKPSTSYWPPLYEELFDIGKDDISRYEEEVKKRLDEIKKRWLEHKPQATVCFGTSPEYMEKLKYLFSNGQALSFTKHPNHNIFYNDESRVLISQHCASRWWRRGRSDKEKIKIIRGKLKEEWKIELP